MARKRTGAPASVGLFLREPREEARQQLMDLLERGRALLAREFSLATQLEEAKRERDLWRNCTQTRLAEMFSSESVAVEFGESTASISISERPFVVEEFDEFRTSMRTYVSRLEAIIARLDSIPETFAGTGRPGLRADGQARVGAGPAPNGEHQRHAASPLAGVRRTGARSSWAGAAATAEITSQFVPSAAAARSPRASGTVLIVSGSQPAADSVAELVEDLGLAPVVVAGLSEDAGGRMAGLEAHAGAFFVVVLLTVTDPAGLLAEMFELGYLVGRLGRERVCVLSMSRAEGPRCPDHLPLIDLDPFGAWRFRLAKEMRAAGLAADLNRVS